MKTSYIDAQGTGFYDVQSGERRPCNVTIGGVIHLSALGYITTASCMGYSSTVSLSGVTAITCSGGDWFQGGQVRCKGVRYYKFLTEPQTLY